MEDIPLSRSIAGLLDDWTTVSRPPRQLKRDRVRGGNIGLHQILGGPIPADQRFACHTDQDPQLGGVCSPLSLFSSLI